MVVALVIGWVVTLVVEWVVALVVGRLRWCRVVALVVGGVVGVFG